jgi:hypothetical protein
MHADRYLKVVLTIIALELAWIGFKNFSDPASAQDAPARVVIAGIDIDAARPVYLPVAVVGSIKTIPAPLRASIDPLSVRVNAPVQIDTQQRPLKIEADKPLKVEADKPLPVETVRYTPGARPGE